LTGSLSRFAELRPLEHIRPASATRTSLPPARPVHPWVVGIGARTATSAARAPARDGMPRTWRSAPRGWSAAWRCQQPGDALLPGQCLPGLPANMTGNLRSAAVSVGPAAAGRFACRCRALSGSSGWWPDGRHAPPGATDSRRGPVRAVAPSAIRVRRPVRADLAGSRRAARDGSAPGAARPSWPDRTPPTRPPPRRGSTRPDATDNSRW